jgi:hypothetical protein
MTQLSSSSGCLPTRSRRGSAARQPYASATSNASPSRIACRVALTGNPRRGRASRPSPQSARSLQRGTRNSTASPIPS